MRASSLGISGRFRRLLIGRSGSIVTWVVFTLPILMGTLALAIDSGQLFALNTDLQKHASAAAIAGAAELCGGTDGARVRAERAARQGFRDSTDLQYATDSTLKNDERFATDNKGALIQVADVRFLSNLPPDGTAITADDLATSDSDARFIYVRVEDRHSSNVLGWIITNTGFDTGAEAIAGCGQVVCKFPALMVCNPLEDPTYPVGADCSVTPGTGAPFDPDCMRGKQVLMKAKGGTGQWGPGNFGLVENPDGSNGASATADYLANAAPAFCTGDRINTEPGSKTGPIKAAINTRFDLYENPMFSGGSSKPEYRPALDVVKGYTVPPGETACNATADPGNAMALPRDSCFSTGTCPSGRFGDGKWDCLSYWQFNHAPGDLPPNGCVNANASLPPGVDRMSRFQIYRYEVTHNDIPNNSPSGENGNPQCYTGGTMSDPSQDPDNIGPDEIDRRVLVMAVVDCVQNGPVNGNETNLPVTNFVKVMLTEPVQCDGGDCAAGFDLWGEIIDVLGPGQQDNSLHDIVQLYR